MRKFIDGPNTLWVPKLDHKMRCVEGDETYINATIELCTSRVLYRNIIRKMYGQSPTHTVLRAHGGTIGKGLGWHYGDQGTTKLVQEWIDSVDGTAQVILLWVCNTSSFTVRSKVSTLIYPRKHVSLMQAHNDLGLFCMFIPGLGQVHRRSAYQLRKFLDQFK